MKKRKLILCLTLMLACAGTAMPVFADTTTTQQTETSIDDSADKNASIPDIVRFTVAASGITKTKTGSLVMADRVSNVVRVRNKAGEYRILAGKEGKSGYKNGSAKKALFNAPWDVVPYKDGWLISDTENHVLRLCLDAKVTTVAGTGKAGYKNATGKSASFNRPTGMAVGKNGEVYISDTGNHVIRMIDKKGKVTTFAGSKKGCANGTLKKAKFNEPTGLYYYNGALYVADSGNHRICKIENGKVTTVAGSAKGVEGDKNGSALNARLSNPQEIILYKNVMYISDTGNASVKKLENGKVTTLITPFSLGDGRQPAEPCGMTIQGGFLYVGDIFTEELIQFEL